jgi:hypothetical protein
MLNYMNLIVPALLGGELLSCNTSVMLIRLKYHASDHYRSATCHVPEIHKDARISRCNLPGYPDPHYAICHIVGRYYVR